MSTDPIVDLDQRRPKPQSAQPDHRSRVQYDYATEALEDAMRLVSALLDHQALLVPTDELEFTVHRAQGLIQVAIESLERAAQEMSR